MKAFIASFLLLCLTYINLEAKPSHPFPSHQNYYESISPSAYSQKQLDNNIKQFYKQWKKDFLVKESSLYRIATDKKNKTKTVSEGQGYGMMIIAYMAGYENDAQQIFDGLYLYALKHPSLLHKELMTWRIPEKKGDNDSAFDGDADIAFALLLAHRQWGSHGKINYKKEALKRIKAIMTYTIGKKSYLPLLGDWVDQNGKKYNQYTTRSSDFMLSHFRVFYLFSHDIRWIKTINSCQNALKSIQNLPYNKSRLISDFLYYDKKKKSYFPTHKNFLEAQDDSYYYNACRVPWRIGIDALMYHNKNSRQIVQKMLYGIYKITKANPMMIKSGYKLDGSVIGNYNSTAFIAPFCIAAKTTQSMQTYLDKLYELIYNKHENYYEDSINLLSQLIIAEDYWEPIP